MRRLPSFFRAWLCMAPWLLTACASDLTPAQEVIEPRLYGARIEVGGDPARARPVIGESFVIRQFLVVPKPLKVELADLYDMQLALCLGTRAPDGSILCAEELPITTQITPVSELEFVTSPILVPDPALFLPEGANAENLLSAFDRLILFGAVCVEGQVERIADKNIATDPPSQLFRCTKNSASEFKDPLSFTMTLGLDLGRLGDPNQNPSFACDTQVQGGACNEGVSVEGERPSRVEGPFVLVYPEKKGTTRKAAALLPYPKSEVPRENCKDDPDLLQVSAGSGEHLLRVRFDASDRERYQVEREEFGKLVIKDLRETLEVNHSVVEFGGELPRHLTVLRAEVEDDQAEIEVTYEPPEQSAEEGAQIPKNGRSVRFFFSVRDQRGGFDFTTRDVCLVPKE